MELDKLSHERTQIVTECRLQLENIDCLYSPIRIRFQDNEKLFIEREWEKEVKRKPTIFNGKLFHVKWQEFLLPWLVFDTCMSSFKEWIGTKSNRFRELFGQNRIIKPMSVGTMIVTADNKWSLGLNLI